jgi:hypothetical protein
MLGTEIIHAKMKNNTAPEDDKVTVHMIKAPESVRMQLIYRIKKT